MPDLNADTAKRFAADTANHQMTVLHDDGLYRHLRFQQPDRSGYWFDIVTWPGSLAVRGDMGGGYVFSRVPDMFEFFRANGNDHGINPGYWAEKLPTGRQSVKEYSEDVFKTLIAEALTDYDQGYPELAAEYTKASAKYEALPKYERFPYLRTGMREPFKPKTPAEVRQMVADAEDDGSIGYEAGARELLGELESAGVVSDPWERTLSDWDYSFLWFCHAIVWGIGQYDAARAPRQAAKEVAR